MSINTGPSAIHRRDPFTVPTAYTPPKWPLPFAESLNDFTCFCGRVLHVAALDSVSCECGRQWQRRTPETDLSTTAK
jgi:hypothetical protein